MPTKNWDIKNIVRDLAFVSFTTYWAAFITGFVMRIVAIDHFAILYGVNFLATALSLVLIGRWTTNNSSRHIIVVSALLWLLSLTNINFQQDWMVDFALISANCFVSSVIAVVMMRKKIADDQYEI